MLLVFTQVQFLDIISSNKIQYFTAHFPKKNKKIKNFTVCIQLLYIHTYIDTGICVNCRHNIMKSQQLVQKYVLNQ